MNPPGSPAAAGLKGVRVRDEVLTVTLVALAAWAWWLTIGLSSGMESGIESGMSSGMSSGMGSDAVQVMALGPFLLAWALMMAAMMLPAVTPVVRLYQRGAAAGRVAPTGYFAAAYLAVWVLTGLPAYLLWQVVEMPLAEGTTWALRLAAATLVGAGLYQLSGLKRACLTHCRSPMAYFMRLRGSLDRPAGAFGAGVLHAAYCCGCCLALMAVLVVSAAMSPWWAVLLALGIFVERNVRWGARFATALGIGLLALGTSALASPTLLTHLT